jgi:integrase
MRGDVKNQASFLSKANGKRHEYQFADAAIRTCDACGMKLWPKAIPWKMTFHDLRHTNATQLLRKGVDLHRVQRLVRHRDIRLTVRTYGRLLIEDLREGVNAIMPAEMSTPFAANLLLICC